MNRDILSASAVMSSIVPITRFNRGEANKIFEEVSESGFKVVVKNNKPACVLLSTDMYDEMVEMIADNMLYNEAEARMANNDDKDDMTQEELMRELGIDESDLDDVEVDIE